MIIITAQSEEILKLSEAEVFRSYGYSSLEFDSSWLMVTDFHTMQKGL